MSSSVMPKCRFCGEYVYLNRVFGQWEGWRHWKSGAICCTQEEDTMAEPVSGQDSIYGPIVQCKVTAATVNYPCSDAAGGPCDPACAPGSTDTPTLKGEWGPPLRLGIIDSVEEVL